MDRYIYIATVNMGGDGHSGMRCTSSGELFKEKGAGMFIDSLGKVNENEDNEEPHWWPRCYAEVV